MTWQGQNNHASLDEALQDLDDALAQILRDLYKN
jgi:predicted RNase H-like HicB family nuclease